MSHYDDMVITTSTNDFVETQPREADEILTDAARLIRERGKNYDKGEERSFNKIATVFNALTGKDVSDEEVALLLTVLKLVRYSTSEEYHQDSIDDAISYLALLAEIEESK